MLNAIPIILSTERAKALISTHIYEQAALDIRTTKYIPSLNIKSNLLAIFVLM